MKKILALITLSLGISLAPFSASAHGPAPQKVEKTITIKADPAKVWAIVKYFCKHQRYWCWNYYLGC